VRAAAYEYALSPWLRLLPVHSLPDPPPAEPGRRALLDTLLNLPPSYRRALLLHDGLGLGLPEVAAETEASTPAATNRVLNARRTLAERLPELSEPAVLRERLTDLAYEGPPPLRDPVGAVRARCEARARFWTRTALGVSGLIVVATAFTLATAPTRYKEPLAPGRPVDGIRAYAGAQPLTAKNPELRRKLLAEPANGPGRLVPQIR